MKKLPKRSVLIVLVQGVGPNKCYPEIYSRVLCKEQNTIANIVTSAMSFPRQLQKQQYHVSINLPKKKKKKKNEW